MSAPLLCAAAASTYPRRSVDASVLNTRRIAELWSAILDVYVGVTAVPEASVSGATCFVLLTSDRIKVRDCAACPIDLHGLARFVRHAHRSLRNTSPAAVLIAELRTHVWLFTVCVGGFTVLLPEQRERDTLLGQFAVDVLVVDDCIGYPCTFFVGMEELFKLGICDVII